MDDGDSKNNQEVKRERKKVNTLQRYFSYVSNVFSSVWVRRPIQTDNGSKWFVLGCRCSLLFNFRMFLVVVYLTYEAFK
jgi:hypothetical protein